MSNGNLDDHLDYDEESLNEKAKRGAGLFTLVGSGILSIVHTLSHIIPAVGVIGFSVGGKYEPLYNLVSSEYMQLAYIPFVALSFWYMYRDHRHHKHEKELRKENERLRELLSKK